MEYTYEFLRKCHGLRFRATINNKPQEGVIKVTRESVILCYGEETYGYLLIFGRHNTLTFSERTFSILPDDFEIVPRDPEKYTDWQVGDKISFNADVYTVIFRYEEVVLYKCGVQGETRCCARPYICEELFRDGFRLVLTDIEKQIIEEKNWQPQDGDIVAWKDKADDEGFAITIYRGNHRGYFTLFTSGNTMDENKYDNTIAMNIIRPATEEEKQKLFDAMVKAGKRWNASKKKLEDFPKPYEFKKGEPVLVRDYDDNIWKLATFRQRSGNACYPYEIRDERGNYCYHRYCIPYNERTMHMLGTTEDYREEQA